MHAVVHLFFLFHPCLVSAACQISSSPSRPLHCLIISAHHSSVAHPSDSTKKHCMPLTNTATRLNIHPQPPSSLCMLWHSICPRHHRLPSVSHMCVCMCVCVCVCMHKCFACATVYLLQLPSFSCSCETERHPSFQFVGHKCQGGPRCGCVQSESESESERERESLMGTEEAETGDLKGPCLEIGYRHGVRRALSTPVCV